MQMTHIYITINPDDKGPLESLKSCIKQISTWMNHNVLQLNKDKTETIVFGAKKERATIRTQLEKILLKTSDNVRNLGVVMDSDFNFKKHIKGITKSAFYHLKTKARLKTLMTQHNLDQLVCF